MSTMVEYRGYTISSTPSQPLGTHKWKSEIVISSEREGVVTTQSYTGDTTHATEEDADTEGVRLGQQMIDGKAPAVSDS